jgi:alpha-galactosidase
MKRMLVCSLLMAACGGPSAEAPSGHPDPDAGQGKADGTGDAGTAPGGLARTPPMGFNTWNNFGHSFDEQLILEIADAMVASGMRGVGYEYVCIDDAWQKYPGARDDHPGDLEPDPDKFPSGIAHLADQLHARGLKLGLYSGGDQATCAGFTGSLGHEEQDARTFAAWGVDLLKYDTCCISDPEPSERDVRSVQEAMGGALQASGRDIVFSAVHCGWVNVQQWARDVGGHMWRINQDIADTFEGPFPDDYYMPIKAIIDVNSDPETNYARHAGPGGWNDMDMLVVGLKGRSGNGESMPGGGCTDAEYRTHFSMWSMLASPLLAGNDLRNMGPDTLTILTNAEVIALNQDPLGKQALKVKDTGDLEWFVKPLAGGEVAVALLNGGARAATMVLDFAAHAGLDWPQVAVRDLWAHEELGIHSRAYSVTVASHATVVLRLRRP